MSRSKRTMPQPYMQPIQIMILRAALVMTVVLTITCLALASQFDLARGGSAAQALPTQQPAAEDTAPAPAPAPENSSSPEGDCQVSQRFPEAVRQWCDQITRSATTYGLPPNLVAAVVWFESGGNPTAYSHSGATGLMQVMPRDGLAASFQCANGPCFANRPSRAELEDPAFNIEYGARMLANLYERTQNWRDALYSYGPIDVGYTYADRVLAIFTSYSGD